MKAGSLPASQILLSITGLKLRIASVGAPFSCYRLQTCFLLSCTAAGRWLHYEARGNHCCRPYRYNIIIEFVFPGIHREYCIKKFVLVIPSRQRMAAYPNIAVWIIYHRLGSYKGRAGFVSGKQCKRTGGNMITHHFPVHHAAHPGIPICPWRSQYR